MLYENDPLLGTVEKRNPYAAEFNIYDDHLTTKKKFKVRIYCEEDKAGYIGYANLRVENSAGLFDYCMGEGITIEEALQNTLNSLIRQVNALDSITDKKFEWIDNTYNV